MSRPLSTLTVVGLGKLGAPMAACFAAKGFEVIGVDVNGEFVAAINDGRPPVFEPGLESMLAKAGERLSATTDLVTAVGESDVTFVIVPTPSEMDGGFSLKHVLHACEEIGRAISAKDGYHLVCVTSTVMPGATGGPIKEALEFSSGLTAGRDFGLCYSPEFIALGSVIQDFLEPDFLLIGESDSRAGDLLAEIYERTCESNAPVARMNFVNAELAKIAVNTYVTTKITFANMIARICERLPEADVDTVTAALGLDSRIGPRYLRGAISYGGPCFPRDNVALATLARHVGAPALLAEATDSANREHLKRLADLIVSKLDSAPGTVAVLGLAYKPGTDVVEESPGLLLALELDGRGVDVVAYDPAGMANARRGSEASEIRYAHSAVEAIGQADVAVVTTPWEEFRQLSLIEATQDGRPRVVIDCWRFLDAAALSRSCDFVALGEWLHEPITAPASAG